MNEYKITYAGESEGYRIITDRTEAAAKKFFREEAKSLDLGRITIESVELLNTNALASKRNERETLEIIRQLVADLGEQSYLATAFEGCFEDAESNIENDFGDSWKRRCEIAEEKLRQEIEEKQRVRQDAEAAVKKLELDNRDLRAAIGKVKANLAKTEQALKDQSLSPDDLEDIRQLLSDRATEADEAATKAASEIVKYADQPESKELQQAVVDHRNYTREAEYTRNILERVVAAQAAAHLQGEGQAA